MEEYIKKSDALAAAKYDYSVWVKINKIKPAIVVNDCESELPPDTDEKREEA